jgi:hypothetical protein
MRSGVVLASALVGAGLLLSGCTSAAQPTPARSAPPSAAGLPGTLPRPDHVLVAVFENEDAGDVVGSDQAPALTALAAAGTQFTDAHAETHPSQGNYLALFSGSTQGVTDDDCPVDLTGDNLAAQLLAAGLSFGGWSEGLPRTGFTGCEAGDYARKHNPWVDFTDLPASVNQPYSAMPDDYAQLPTVSFVVPDLCNDMHDCGVAAGDAWAGDNLVPYAGWAAQHNSLLIVTFDENDGGGDNHIPTFVVGAGVAATTSDQRIDHYSLLRSIEDMYGLPPLGKAAGTDPLTGIWTTPG